MSEHDAIQTLAEPCPVCGGCEWVCAEAREEDRQRLEAAFWMGHTEGRLFAAKDTGKLDGGTTREELKRAGRIFSGWAALAAGEERQMKVMRKIEMLEVLEAPHRVQARLVCGHLVESWAGAHIGALRRCYECEGMRSPMQKLGAALAAGESEK